MEEIAPLRMTAARAPSPLPTIASPPIASEPRPPGWLTPAELDAVAALRQRDQQVRQDEHNRLVDAGVWLRSGIDYEYRVGPDGRRYAVDAHPGMVAALAPMDDAGGRSPPVATPASGDDGAAAPGQSLDVSA